MIFMFISKQSTLFRITNSSPQKHAKISLHSPLLSFSSLPCLQSSTFTVSGSFRLRHYAARTGRFPSQTKSPKKSNINNKSSRYNHTNDFINMLCLCLHTYKEVFPKVCCITKDSRCTYLGHTHSRHVQALLPVASKSGESCRPCAVLPKIPVSPLDQVCPGNCQKVMLPR